MYKCKLLFVLLMFIIVNTFNLCKNNVCAKENSLPSYGCDSLKFKANHILDSLIYPAAKVHIRISFVNSYFNSNNRPFELLLEYVQLANTEKLFCYTTIYIDSTLKNGQNCLFLKNELTNHLRIKKFLDGFWSQNPFEMDCISDGQNKSNAKYEMYIKVLNGKQKFIEFQSVKNRINKKYQFVAAIFNNRDFFSITLKDLSSHLSTIKDSLLTEYYKNPSAYEDNDRVKRVLPVDSIINRLMENK